MAETLVPAGDPTAVTIYSHRVFHQALRNTTAAKLMAVGLNPRDQTNFVQWFDEPTKGPGDTVKYTLFPNISGPGVAGDAVMAGQEAALSWFQDSIVLNQLRNAVLLVGRMSQQRIAPSLRDEAKVALSNWIKDMIDFGLMNQLGGNSAQTNTNYTGMQAATAPTTANWLFGTSGSNVATSEATLDSTDTFKISDIPRIVAKAQTGLQFPIKPVVIKGIEIAGILFLHPYQVRDLKTNFTTGEWGDIYRAALQGGQITGNPLFTGAIGMKDSYVPELGN